MDLELTPGELTSYYMSFLDSHICQNDFGWNVAIFHNSNGLDHFQNRALRASDACIQQSLPYPLKWFYMKLKEISLTLSHTTPIQKWD